MVVDPDPVPPEARRKMEDGDRSNREGRFFSDLGEGDSSLILES